jgi:PAS domain-containing protein
MVPPQIGPRMFNSIGSICRFVTSRHRPVTTVVVLGATILTQPHLMISGLAHARLCRTGARFAALGHLLVPSALRRQFPRFGRSELWESRSQLEARTIELTRVASELRLSEERARDFAEISANWFWEQNADLRYTWFSEAIAHPELTFNLIGQTRWEMVTEGVTEQQWVEHRALLAARQPFRDFRYQRTGSDGIVHHISVSGNPIFDEAQTFCGYRGAGREITAQVAAEETLRQAKAEAEQQHSLVQEMSKQLLEAQRLGKIGHWISDEINQTVTWSPQMFEIAGLPLGSDIPMNIPRKVVQPDDLQGFLDARAQAIATRTHRNGRAPLDPAG